MKLTTSYILGSLLASAISLCASRAAGAENTTALTCQEDRDSYAAGVDLARALKRRGAQLETEALLGGFRDVLSGQKLQISEEDLRAGLRTLQIAERQGQIPAGGGATPSQRQTNGYVVGVDLARSLKRQGVPLEVESLLGGIRDVLSGQKLQMSEDNLRETLHTLQIAERQRRILAGDSSEAVALRNAEQGAAFLAQNKTNAGVVTLPSGLQYKVLKAGNGQRPTAADTIECRFRGTLIDGQQFAGTGPDGPPATFKLSELIAGWKDALQLMPAGSKWELFIPPQLAYGKQGAGRSKIGTKIGPNATLVYELELLAIKKPDRQ